MALNFDVLAGVLGGYANAQRQQNLSLLQNEINNRQASAELFSKIALDNTNPPETRRRALEIYEGIHSTPYTKKLPTNYGSGAMEYLTQARVMPSAQQPQAGAPTPPPNPNIGGPLGWAPTPTETTPGGMAPSQMASVAPPAAAAPTPPPTLTGGAITPNDYLFSQANAMNSMAGTGYLSAQPGYAQPAAAMPMTPGVVGTAPPVSPALAGGAPAVPGAGASVPAAIPSAAPTPEAATPSVTTPGVAGTVGIPVPGTGPMPSVTDLRSVVPTPPPPEQVAGLTAPPTAAQRSPFYSQWELNELAKQQGMQAANINAYQAGQIEMQRLPGLLALEKMKADVQYDKLGFQNDMKAELAGYHVVTIQTPYGPVKQLVPKDPSEESPEKQAQINQRNAAARKAASDIELNGIKKELAEASLPGGAFGRERIGELQARQYAIYQNAEHQRIMENLQKGTLDLKTVEMDINGYGIDPRTGLEVPGVAHDQFGNPIGRWFERSYRITTPNLTMAQRAKPVYDAADDLIAFAGNNPDEFGMSGKFRQWLAGKIGSDDTQLGVLGSLLTNYINNSMSMYNNSKKDAEDALRAQLNTANSPQAFAAVMRSLGTNAGRIMMTNPAAPGGAGARRPAQVPAPNPQGVQGANNPRPGDVVNGFRFNGGDPNNKLNWSRQ